MFLAEEAAQAASKIGTFDWFMLAFTVLIAIGLVRLLNERPKKNIFAIGFTTVSLALFVLIDFIMITKVWLA